MNFKDGSLLSLLKAELEEFEWFFWTIQLGKEALCSPMDWLTFDKIVGYY
jgi:hypothetical protein